MTDEINFSSVNNAKFKNQICKNEDKRVINDDEEISIFSSTKDCSNKDIMCFNNTDKYKFYNRLVNNLDNRIAYAEETFSRQKASDGIFGKSAEFISALWGSEKRSVLVDADIKIAKIQSESLKTARDLDEHFGSTSYFETEFKNIYGVEYNKDKIEKFKTASEKFRTAASTKFIADTVESTLIDNVENFKLNKGEYKDLRETKFIPKSTGFLEKTKITAAKDLLSKLENDLIDVLGTKETLNNIAKSIGIENLEDLPENERYYFYGNLAQDLINNTKNQANLILGDHSLKELKEMNDELYSEAFGNNNDIARRVEDYNQSQELGKILTKGLVTTGAVAVTVATLGSATPVVATLGTAAPLIVGAGATTANKILVDYTEKLTNNIDNKEDLSGEKQLEIVKNGVISGVAYAATMGLTKYGKLAEMGSSVVNPKAKTIIDIAKKTAVETTIGSTEEILKKGSISIEQILVRSLIASLFSSASTYTSGLNESVTKSAIDVTNKAAKSLTKNTSIIKTRDPKNDKKMVDFVKNEIKVKYEKEPDKYLPLIKLAQEAPEELEKLIADELF